MTCCRVYNWYGGVSDEQGQIKLSGASGLNFMEYSAVKSCPVDSRMAVEKYCRFPVVRTPRMNGGGVDDSGISQDCHAKPS
jgi:hypothetical protein